MMEPIELPFIQYAEARMALIRTARSIIVLLAPFSSEEEHASVFDYAMPVCMHQHFYIVCDDYENDKMRVLTEVLTDCIYAIEGVCI